MFEANGTLGAENPFREGGTYTLTCLPLGKNDSGSFGKFYVIESVDGLETTCLGLKVFDVHPQAEPDKSGDPKSPPHEEYAYLCALENTEHVPTAYAFGRISLEDRDSLAIIEERISGVDFKGLQRALSSNMHGAAIPPKAAVNLGMALSIAIESLYLRDENGVLHGVVHRDVGNNNLRFLLGEDGSISKAFVIDFGQSTMKGKLAASIDWKLANIAYGAPEMFLFDQERDTTKADVWSIGAMLYEARTGNYPFEAEITDLLEEQSSKPINQIEYCNRVAKIKSSQVSLPLEELERQYSHHAEERKIERAYDVFLNGIIEKCTKPVKERVSAEELYYAFRRFEAAMADSPVRTNAAWPFRENDSRMRETGECQFDFDNNETNGGPLGKTVPVVDGHAGKKDAATRSLPRKTPLFSRPEHGESNAEQATVPVASFSAPAAGGVSDGKERSALLESPFEIARKSAMAHAASPGDELLYDVFYYRPMREPLAPKFAEALLTTDAPSLQWVGSRLFFKPLTWRDRRRLCQAIDMVRLDRSIEEGERANGSAEYFRSRVDPERPAVLRTRVSSAEAVETQKTIEAAGGAVLFLSVPSSISSAMSSAASSSFGAEGGEKSKRLVESYGNRYVSCSGREGKWVESSDDFVLSMLYRFENIGLSAVSAQEELCSVLWDALGEKAEDGVEGFLKRACTRHLCTEGRVDRRGYLRFDGVGEDGPPCLDWFDHEYARTIINRALAPYEAGGDVAAPEDRSIAIGVLFPGLDSIDYARRSLVRYLADCDFMFNEMVELAKPIEEKVEAPTPNGLPTMHNANQASNRSAPAMAAGESPAGSKDEKDGSPETQDSHFYSVRMAYCKNPMYVAAFLRRQYGFAIRAEDLPAGGSSILLASNLECGQAKDMARNLEYRGARCLLETEDGLLYRVRLPSPIGRFELERIGF